MSFDNLNKWMTLGANIGVLAGIVFLALEIRQNSQMMEAQTRSQISQSVVNLIESDRDPRVVRAIFQERSGGPISEEDRYYLQTRARLFLRTWENTYYQYRNGLLDEEEFEADRKAWRGIMNQKHFREEWERSGDVYSPEFVSIINETIN